VSVVSEDIARRARIRALAVAIHDAPETVRRFVATDVSRISLSPRLRRHAKNPDALGITRAQKRVRFWILGLEVGLFAVMMTAPAFAVSQAKISGNVLLDTAQIQAATGITSKQNIFTVSGEDVRQRLLQSGWIRQVQVETSLPNVVSVSLVEWTPAVDVRRADSDLLVAPSGVTTVATASELTKVHQVPLLLDKRPSDLRSNTFDGGLARLLNLTAAQFQTVFGVGLLRYEWLDDGRMAIVTNAGWDAVLGHMDTQAQIARFPDQMASLLALKTKVNLNQPNFGYIDLQAPAQPVVGGTPNHPEPNPAPAQSSLPAQPAVKPANNFTLPARAH
jgi:cell division septal protein FtsQ